MKRSHWFLLVAMVVLLGSSASSVQAGSTSMNMPGMVMGTATVKPTVVATSMRVVLTLSEFHIDVTPTPVPAIKVGEPVELVIVNAGQLAHEMMLMPPGSPDKMAGMSMNSMDAMSPLTVESAELPPGGAPVIRSFVFTSPGKWTVACMLPGHNGMKASITVVA